MSNTTPDWLSQGATPAPTNTSAPDWLTQGATLANPEAEQDGAFMRGLKTAGQSAKITGQLAAQDAAGVAQSIKEAELYRQENPGTKEGDELAKAWDSGDGGMGGVANVAGEFAKDYREAKGFWGGVKATGANLEAMRQGIVSQLGNSIAPMVGMVAGSAAGAAAGSAAPVVGNVAGGLAGGWAGASIGNTLVEGGGQVQDALQKAGIDPLDTAAVEKFIAENGDRILGRSAMKGGIIGAVDAATMRFGGRLSSKPIDAAMDRAFAILGIDAADKVAVNAAIKSGEIAKRVAADPIYQASQKGAQKLIREGTVAALDPAGEFTGEYVGQGVATGDWDTKNAALEALSSVGQSGIMYAGQKGYQYATNPLRGSGAANQNSGTATPAAPGQPLQLGNSPDPLIQFRDGTVARQSEIDAHLASLPESERQTFVAQILGYAPQQADEQKLTTSPGATQFDGVATEQPSESVAAPDFGTSLGAQPEQQGGGLEFQRQIDTSGLSLERLDSPFAQPVPATALDRQALARQGAYPTSPTPAPVLDTRRLSEKLGLSSNRGGLEAAAAMAVDSGASPISQAANTNAFQQGGINGTQTQEAQQAVAGQSQGAGAQERVAAAPKIRAVKLKDGTTAHVNEADLTSGASLLRTFTADGKPRAVRLPAANIAPAAPKVVLQNRNRATPASIAQMNAIASKPDFLRTGASNTMDNGAPIVFGDLPQKVAIGRAQMVADGNGQRVPTQYAVVEAQDLITSNHADGSPVAEYANGVDGKLRAVAGNGRAAGLKAAWQRGTAGQYGQELMQDAPNLGIAPEVLAQFEAPVLVRVMDAADVTPDMGDRSNVQAGLQMSAVEQASNDAQRLNLRDMEFDELGNPTAQTVMRFMQGMPVQERGNMLDSQGRATSQLLDRIRAAAFKQAYMSDSLVELAAQSADPEAKNILNGLAIVAGDMAQLAGAGDFDIRQAVTDAANMAVTAARTGQSLAQYLQTRQIDENAETVVVMQFMAQNVRSAKRIADGLRAWAELAQSQVAIARQNAEQDTMFGDTPTLSRRELFERLNNDNLTEIEQQQLIEQQRRVELAEQGAQRPSTERAGNADGASDGAESRGTEPTNAQDAGREQADFALEQQTPEQIRAQEEAQSQAARDKAKEDAQAAEAERKAVERQEVTQRSEAVANDFQLGQSAEDNLSGQGDIFAQQQEATPEAPPKTLKEGLERVRAKKAAEKPAKNDATRLGSGATGVADNALSGKDAGAPYQYFEEKTGLILDVPSMSNRDGTLNDDGKRLAYTEWSAMSEDERALIHEAIAARKTRSQQADDSVRKEYLRAEKARLEGERIILSSNGNPYKTEGAAAKFIEEKGIEESHYAGKVDGGWAAVRRTPSEMLERENGKKGIEDYTTIQSRVVAEMGLTQAWGEDAITDAQWEKIDNRVDAIQRGQRGLPPVEQATDEAKPAQAPSKNGEWYTLPTGSVSDSWRDKDGRYSEHPNFAANDRQKRLIAEVKKAREKGLFYNEEIKNEVASSLGVSDEIRAINTTGVGGGDFGFDIYHAIKALDAQQKEAEASKIRTELSLKVGDQLGTLVFNDFKQTNKVEVVGLVNDGRSVKLKGKRGVATATFEADVPSVKYAIERAHEKGKRKDSYEEFIAGRAAIKRDLAATPQADESVTVPKGSTRGDVVKALRDTGAISKNTKVFGASGEQANDLAYSRRDNSRNQGEKDGKPNAIPSTATVRSRRLEAGINTDLERNGQSGLFRAESIAQNELPNALGRALVAFREATGTAVHIFRNLTPEVVDFNGVNFRDGVVHINENNQYPLTLAATHEWLHNMRRTHPALYSQLAQEVARQGRLSAYQQRLKKDGETRWANGDVVQEELTAAAVSDALTDPAFLQKLAERKPGYFARMARAFLDFLNTLTSGWKDQGSNAYLRDVEAFRDKLAAVLDLYEATTPAARAKIDKANFLRVWHGTPHRGIEQTGFKLNKIGTGEGAQAYGWGMYFASAREVAEGYRKALEFNDNEVQDEAEAFIDRADGSDRMAIADLLHAAKNTSLDPATRKLYEDAAQWIKDGKKKTNPGQLYSAEIPENDELLDWDKPLNEQPQKVLDALNLYINLQGYEHYTPEGHRAPVLVKRGISGDTTGQQLYNSALFGNTPQEKSDMLRSAGIPGLRYLDGNSRSRGEGSHNYVIWDEALLTPEKAQIEAMYSRGRSQGASVATIRQSAGKAYGKLLEKLEAKGLVHVAQTEEDALQAAAKARAAKTGQSVAQELNGLRQSVQNSIAVWHGTPHRGIEKTGFKLNKIGTGEGAQAYGWGMYFASMREVAQQYQPRNPGAEDAMLAEYKAAEKKGDWESLELWEAALLHNLSADIQADDVFSHIPQAKRDAVARKMQEIGKKHADGGNLYEVALPIEESDLLDWDKPLSEQPQNVLDALKSAGILYKPTMTGSAFYQNIQRNPTHYLDKVLSGLELTEAYIYPDRGASMFLNALGIPGLRYLDGNSRIKGEGSHNYVIWDEALLTPEKAQIEAMYSKGGAIEGFFDRQTGKSFLVADGLTEETAPATLMHEVGIHMAADGSMQGVFNRAAMLVKNSKDEFMNRVRDRMEAAGETSAEEAAAYIVTEYEKDRTNAPASIKQFMKDFMAAVRAWLFRNGFTQVVKEGNLTPADISAIARANARSLANGANRADTAQNSRQNLAFSEVGSVDGAALQRQFDETARAYGGQDAYAKAKADGKTNLNYGQWVQVRTPNFKAWFGDWENDPANASKVVDSETGEPLVVYHGSSVDVGTTFLREKLGENTQAKSSFGGFFFASNPETASSPAYATWDRELTDDFLKYEYGLGDVDKFNEKVAPLVPSEIKNNMGAFNKALSLIERDATEAEGVLLDNLDEFAGYSPKTFTGDENEDYYLANTLRDIISIIDGEYTVMSDDRESMVKSPIGKDILDEVFKYFPSIKRMLALAKDLSLTDQHYHESGKFYQQLGEEEDTRRFADQVKAANVGAYFLNLRNPKLSDQQGSEYRNETYSSLIEEAASEGKDGTVIRNTFDGGRELTDVMVAIHANQIKSAISNSGNFDGANPDIRFSHNPSTQAAQNTADSRASTAAQNPSNPSQVWAAIEGVFEGIDGLRQRLDAGTTVVRSADELPQQFQQAAKDAQAQGFYDDKSKRIYLVADRIEAGQEKAVWLHEVFHKRGSELLGDTVMARLHGAVQRWSTRKAGSVERQIYDAAHARAQADGNYNGEFLAYAIEEAVNRGVQPDLKTNIISAGYWLGKVMEAFRSALNKLTGRAATPKITADELVDIAYGAAGLEVERNGPPTRLETMPQTELTLEELGGGLENIVRETESGKRIINADVEAQLRRIMSPEQFRADGSFGERTNRKLNEIIQNTRVKVGETKQEQERRYLSAAMKAWAHVIRDAHKNAHMVYRAMPVAEFNNEDNPLIHKSKSYNGRQSSEYRLVLVDGKPAFARKSNHWGAFTTNIYEGSEDAKRLGLKNDTRDQFGRVGWKSHNWELEGGNVDSRNSQAGYVLLEDLVKAAWQQDDAARNQAKAKELEVQKTTELPLQLSRAYGGQDAYAKAKADGKTKLTYGQWVQVRTPNFKAWFGDWENDPANASKVVDSETGEPLVVYHGTRYGGFSVFDKSNSGIWFTESRDLATTYTGWTDEWYGAPDITRYDQQDEQGVVPAFLYIKNPLAIDFRGKGALSRGKSPADWFRGMAKSRDGVQISNVFDRGDVIGGGISEADGEDTTFAVRSPNQIKSAIGNNGNFDGTNPDIRFSRAAPTAGAGVWQSPEPTKFDQWTYLLQDKQIDTKRVLNAIKNTGQQVDDAQDVSLQETLYHGRTAKRVKDFAEQEERQLMELMRDKGLSLGQVEEYLHARHAPEANKALAERNPSAEVIAANLKAAQAAGDEGETAKWRNAKPYTGTEEDRLALSGMSDAEAAAVMAALTPEQRTNLQAAAKMVDAIVAKTRQTFVDYGLETQETVDAWGKAWAHYVPLMREQPEDTGMAGMGTGQGFSVKGKETKGRTGSTKKVVDILANINMQRERAIVRGEKNRVAMALLGLVKANPNKDFWRVATAGEVPSSKVVDERTGLVRTQIDPLYKSRDNALVVKVDGQEQVILFNEDNARAMRMAAALKNMDAANLEGMLGNVASVTRYLAAINTQYNPIFGIVNMVRDFQEAAINLQTTPLAGKQKQVLGQALTAVWQVGKELRAQREGKTTGSEWGKLWDDFQAHGGQTGYRDMFTNSADRSRALQALLQPDAWADTKWGKFFSANGTLKAPMEFVRRTALRPLLDLLSDYNEAIENGVRLSAYKTAIEQGMSRERAAELAKNLTVNFNRKGQVAQQVGALYAFFNASVQGTARMGQTLFNMEPGQPKTMRLSPLGKKIVGGAVLLGSVQALLLAAAGFGEDEPPEFIRERNLVIPNPLADKGYTTIPMPLGYHVLANLGRIPTEYALGGFKDGAKRAVSIVDVLADIYNPLGGGGLSMQTISPTVLDPFAALAENKDFTGRPIAKESFNKTTPGHALGRDTSSFLANGLAQAINYATGGTEYTRGELSPTPDQIDYLLGQALGGVGREASKVSQTAQALATGDDLPWHKVPLIGRFYGSADTPAAVQSAYYATMDDVRRHAAEVKGLRNDGRGQEAVAYMQANPQAGMHFAANAAERQVKKLRERISDLKEQGAPREAVRAVETQMVEVMQRFSVAVENRKKLVSA